MKYLKKLLSIFSSSIENPEELSHIVAADEQISRFIFSSDHFKVKGDSKRVLYPAFLPSEKTGTASVYRTVALNELEIWGIDKKYISGMRRDEKVSKGRADVIAKVILENGLSLIPLSEPHPRHADISNYPGEKGQIRLIAMKIAEASTLVLKPTYESNR